MNILKKALPLLLLPFFLCSENSEHFFDSSIKTPFHKESLLQTPPLNEKDYFVYFRTGGFGIFSFDTPMGGPSLGFGTRYRKGYFGCGASANATSIIILPYFSLKGELLYFLTPNESSYFSGLSVEIGKIFIPGMYGQPHQWQSLYHPEINIGKQYRTSTGKTAFATVGFSPPVLVNNEWSKPIISFNYGIGF